MPERLEMGEELARLADGVGRHERTLRVLERHLTELRGLVQRQTDIVTEALRRAGWQTDEEAEEQRMLRRVLQLSAGKEPLIVGPWMGEVGFELLYWIPFVSWLKSRRLSGRPLVVISRGGVASWYRHITEEYVDIFDHLPIQEFRQRAQETKQRRTGNLDGELVARIFKSGAVNDSELLHPSLMYRLFSAFWHGRVPAEFVESFTSFQLFRTDGALPPIEGLPDRYVAAKFYFNESFRNSSENRAFVRSILDAVSQHVPVVLLTTGLQVDDHEESAFADGARIVTLESRMSPATNLTVQTAVIRRALAFVGTYGGFSYLAPFCGVPSLSFFSDRTEFVHPHLELAQRIFSRLAPGSFLAIDRRDLKLVAPAIERWVAAPSPAPVL